MLCTDEVDDETLRKINICFVYTCKVKLSCKNNELILLQQLLLIYHLVFSCILQEQVEPQKPEREPYIENLPPIVFQGRIQYANDFFDCAQICDNLL